MLRQGNTHSYHWADKTMSVLRASQLEACEKYLAGLPDRCLFDADCSDEDAESFYQISFFPREDRKRSDVMLHTVEQLRVRVLSSFAPELALLSSDEHDLIVRLMLFGGKLVLQDMEELIPARSLVRRLWCRAALEDGLHVLYMPHQLCASALLLLAGDGHRKIRDIVEQVQENTDNSLYLMGMTQASGPLLHLRSLLRNTYAENRPDLAERFLCSAFDYIYDHAGRMILIHPGLADPESMLQNMPVAAGACQEMSISALHDASESVGDLESPLYEQMLFSVADAVRPELTPEDAVEDLIILAKQDVPFQDMKEVLSSVLVSLPTAEMLKALHDLSDRIPRWIWFSSSRVQ